MKTSPPSRLPPQVSIPKSFVSVFVFYILSSLLLKRMSWVPGVLCQHSQIVLWKLLNIRMIFWWICGEESGLPILFLHRLGTTSLLISLSCESLARCPGLALWFDTISLSGSLHYVALSYWTHSFQTCAQVRSSLFKANTQKLQPSYFSSKLLTKDGVSWLGITNFKRGWEMGVSGWGLNHVHNLNLGVLLLKGEEENGHWGTTSSP